MVYSEHGDVRGCRDWAFSLGDMKSGSSLHGTNEADIRYEKVPMGVKSVVEAIWEPKQEGELDGLTVETPWSDEDRISEISSWCEKGLGVVGMIYTDLTPCVLAEK